MNPTAGHPRRLGRDRGGEAHTIAETSRPHIYKETRPRFIHARVRLRRVGNLSGRQPRTRTARWDLPRRHSSAGVRARTASFAQRSGTGLASVESGVLAGRFQARPASAGRFARLQVQSHETLTSRPSGVRRLGDGRTIETGTEGPSRRAEPYGSRQDPECGRPRSIGAAEKPPVDVGLR